jgi:hypothetical protein
MLDGKKVVGFDAFISIKHGCSAKTGALGGALAGQRWRSV